MFKDLIKNYKKNIAHIELARMKIAEWKEALKADANAINEMFPKKRPQNLGIDKQQLTTSPTEDIVIRAETLKEKIKLWMIEEKKQIKKWQKETRIVDILLNSLSEEDRFLIELKHFENDKWHIITRKFNKKYRDEDDDYITISGIRKKYTIVIEELTSRLNN